MIKVPNICALLSSMAILVLLPGIQAAHAAARLENFNHPLRVANRYDVLLKDDATWQHHVKDVWNFRTGDSAKDSQTLQSYKAALATDQAQLRSIAEELTTTYGAKLLGMAPGIHAFYVQMSEADATAMANDPRIDTITAATQIQSTQTMSTQTISEPSGLWGLDRIDQESLPLDNAYHYTQTGSNVIVNVIDSGIEASLTDFGGRAGSEQEVVMNGVTVAFGDPAVDCTGHGTGNAGIIGSLTYGVAKGVQLSSIADTNVCLPNGTGGYVEQPAGTSADLAVAIDDTAGLGGLIYPEVVNISQAVAISADVDAAITEALNGGVIIISSAGGNGGAADSCNLSPSAMESQSALITVSATNSDDSLASFADTGGCVTIFAPGANIDSDSYLGNNYVQNSSGVSSATAFVTGVAALYLSSYPTSTPAQVKAAIVAAGTSNVLTGTFNNAPNLLLYSGVPGNPVSTWSPIPIRPIPIPR